jgi:hypothetical protein
MEGDEERRLFLNGGIILDSYFLVFRLVGIGAILDEAVS